MKIEKPNKSIYFILAILLLGAFLVRVWRVDQILWFFYDQGRDALVIWKFLHEGKFFLIGPVTGIEGIFRGPWYYWLITPFYFFGGGDPVWPAVFLGFTTVLAIAILFYLTYRVAGTIAGFVAVVIASFSFYLVLASRWLSNPTPMFLISMLLVLGMFWVVEGKKWAWILIGAMLGMAMQFGSAAEVFYFPAVAVFAIWQRKNLPSVKIAALSFFLIILAFLPQIFFDIRHDGILTGGIKKFLFTDGSFQGDFWEVFHARLNLYYSVFFSKLFPNATRFWPLALSLAVISLLVNLKSLFSNRRFLTVFILLAAPILGMLFFQGNYGNVYDYYFTGYYFIFILIFSSLLSLLVRSKASLIIPALFILMFLQDNLTIVRNYLCSCVDGETHVSLGSEMQAVNWVFEDSQGREFNADVYVPPVIPHAYDYLFLWQATKRCGDNLCGMKLSQNVPLLYTLYEVDPPHPERLEAWMQRQKGVGVVEETTRFGGITVERRHRI